MTSGGRFYRAKVKPSVIQYLEDHFSSFIQYIGSLSPSAAAYFEQSGTVKMNCEQTLTTVATNRDFIPSNSLLGVPAGLISANISNVVKAALLIIGRAVNIFDGQNNLDCTVPADNQWQANVDGGAYADLDNVGKADGQMNDTDWECLTLGSIHPFTFMFDMTGLLTTLSNRIGLRLQNARSRQNSLIVTLDVYLKVVWKL